MEDYAECTIVFQANPGDFEDLVKEGELSAEYSQIVDELEAWLKQRVKGTSFQVRIASD